MVASSRPARIEDVHKLASSMPDVTVTSGPHGNPVYQVGGKSFVFFRNPRPDAVDPDTRERYTDVIVFWVPSEADKLALVQDPASPFFTTPHFDGHPSVLVRGSRIGELTLAELTEIVQDAWLARASPARAEAWLSTQDTGKLALSPLPLSIDSDSWTRLLNALYPTCAAPKSCHVAGETVAEPGLADVAVLADS